MTDGRSLLSLARHGAVHLPGAARVSIGAIEAATAGLPIDRAGIRLHGVAALAHLLRADGPIGALAAERLGPDCRAVRAILFDKSPALNWSLTWHQDRTIAVTRRVDVAGFGPWTRKAGLLHVAPPFALLAEMMTLRVHLDPVTADNAPLLVAPGSHRLGKIPEAEIDETVALCGTFACLADAGDAWLYATPILHASAASARPGRRRVLQVDYAVGNLPGGLEWLGI